MLGRGRFALTTFLAVSDSTRAIPCFHALSGSLARWSPIQPCLCASSSRQWRRCTSAGGARPAAQSWDRLSLGPEVPDRRVPARARADMTMGLQLYCVCFFLSNFLRRSNLETQRRPRYLTTLLTYNIHPFCACLGVTSYGMRLPSLTAHKLGICNVSSCWSS